MQPGLNLLDTDFSKIDPLSIKVNAYIYGADINNGRLFSKMGRNGIVVEIEGSGTSISTILPITFAALNTAIIGSTLIPGQMYIITDYETIYDQPDFDNTGAPKLFVVTKTGAVEPLVIQAISTSDIAKNVFSPSHPLDVIEYDPTFTVTEYMGVPAKGRISYRNDEFDNISDYDHRQVQYLRYETAPGSGIFTVVNDNGGAFSQSLTFQGTAIGNTLGQFAIYHFLGFSFLLSNNVFYNNCYDNKFSDLNFNHTLNINCAGNTLAAGCHNFNLSTNNTNNVFGGSCFDIMSGDSLSNNIFKTGANSITVGINASNNIWGDSSIVSIGNNCISNKFGIATSGTIGNGNENLTIGNNSTITIGANNRFFISDVSCIITLVDSNLNFNIGSNCTLSAGTSNHDFTCGTSCTATILNQNVYNSFGSNCTITLGSQNDSISSGNSNSIAFADLNTSFSIGDRNNITLNNSNDNFIVGNSNAITGNDFNTKNTFKNANGILLNNNSENNNFGNSNLLTIPTSSTFNTFLDSNSNVTFNAPLQNNYFGNGTASAANFAGATHVYAAYQCTLFNNATPANRLSYFSAIDVLTIVNVNA